MRFDLFRNDSVRLLTAMRDGSVEVVVFASNSLRHPDSIVSRRWLDRASLVPQFLRAPLSWLARRLNL